MEAPSATEVSSCSMGNHTHTAGLPAWVWVFEDSGGSGVFNGNAVTIRMTNRLKERLAAETLIIALDVQPMPSP